MGECRLRYGTHLHVDMCTIPLRILLCEFNFSHYMHDCDSGNYRLIYDACATLLIFSGNKNVCLTRFELVTFGIRVQCHYR
jgi:hypothetical protein